MTLSTFDLSSIGVAQMIGAGIFVLVGLAVSKAKGGVTLAVILAMICSICSGLSYANLSEDDKGNMQRDYIEKYISKPLGNITYVAMAVSSILTIAIVAKGLGEYLCKISNYSTNNIAIATVVISAFFNYLGINQVIWITQGTMAAEVVGLIIAIIIGFSQGNYYNEIKTWGSPSSILYAAIIFMFAFTGFETIPSYRKHLKDPDKQIKDSILASIGITGILYLLVALAVIYKFGIQNAAKATIGDMFDSKKAKFMFTIVAICSLFNTVLIAMNSRVEILANKFDRNMILLVIVLVVCALCVYVELKQLAKISSIVVVLVLFLINVCSLKKKLKTKTKNTITEIIGILSSLAMIIGVVWYDIN